MTRRTEGNWAVYEATMWYWVGKRTIRVGTARTRHGLIRIETWREERMTPRYQLYVEFVWMGRCRELRIARSKPFTDLGASRIARRWVRGIVNSRPPRGERS